jgi:hypothetical protein
MHLPVAPSPVLFTSALTAHCESLGQIRRILLPSDESVLKIQIILVVLPDDRHIGPERVITDLPIAVPGEASRMNSTSS